MLINSTIWKRQSIEAHVWYEDNLLGSAFSFLPATGLIPLEVTFTNESIGSPTTFTWDFGDGGGSNEENPVYTYTGPGTFTITLEISDGAFTSTSSQQITVSATAGYPVFELRLDKNKDDNANTADTDIVAKFRTASFQGESLFVMKRPLVMAIDGQFEKPVHVTPYIYREDSLEEFEIAVVESAFIMGVSVMGSATTSFKDRLEEFITNDAAANTYSFEFEFPEEDFYLEMNGHEHTFQAFERDL